MTPNSAAHITMARRDRPNFVRAGFDRMMLPLWLVKGAVVAGVTGLVDLGDLNLAVAAACRRLDYAGTGKHDREEDGPDKC